MKVNSLLLASIALFAGLVTAAFYPSAGAPKAIVSEEMKALEIGAVAPMAEVKMKDVSGESFSLTDLKKGNGLLVIFSCNTCPFVIGHGEKEGWEGRYNGLFETCEKNEMGMVLVNSNEAKRTGDDSMDEMIKRAQEKAYKMNYVLDPGSAMADAFGARTTPHVYLFDKDLKLVYQGKIDDNVNSAKKVKAEYLNDALKNLANGKPCDPNRTEALGCSIKRI
ncbi:redoxin domain-containing protein [bacterium SCSIO 12741]|nr:redoxin domain-containing protein [bacterium SCSIO 12741]